MLLSKSTCAAIRWYNDTRYHYHNPYEPSATQGSRDSAEMPLIEALVANNPGTFRFGEPCVGAGAHRRACVTCPPGAQCVEGVWHPVPAAGRCYRKVEDCLEPANCAGCVGETPATCVLSPGYYGRGLHSFTLELNLSNSRTRS